MIKTKKQCKTFTFVIKIKISTCSNNLVKSHLTYSTYFVIKLKHRTLKNEPKKYMNVSAHVFMVKS